MPTLNGFKEGLLNWLPIIFGAALAVMMGLAGCSWVVTAASAGAPSPMLFTGVMLTVTFAFLLIDYAIFHMNRRQDIQRKVYSPNLKIWGLGLLAGVGSAILYLFGKASLACLGGDAAAAPPKGAPGEPFYVFTLINAAPDKGFVLREELLVFIVLAFLLLLVMWAIVRVVQAE